MINDVATRMIDRRMKALEACAKMAQKVPEHAVNTNDVARAPTFINEGLTPVIGTAMHKGVLENAMVKSMGALPTALDTQDIKRDPK